MDNKTNETSFSRFGDDNVTDRERKRENGEGRQNEARDGIIQPPSYGRFFHFFSLFALVLRVDLGVSLPPPVSLCLLVSLY